ncbi:hypothetical protein [Bacillus thuringiensis]|uniref:hypothetical protein n=1 Tax=Bacillus thuringiensis TaxID=1428 RepID=UPI000BFDBD32|nr:hypothetical protein [Bacillus thuringiensis]PGT89895.1 hypothetical protein COD17_09090 [Bacillus thuringiensis]
MGLTTNAYMIVQPHVWGHYYSAKDDKYVWRSFAGLDCVFPTKQVADLTVVAKGLEKVQVIPVEFKGTGNIIHKQVEGWDRKSESAGVWDFE